MGMAGRLHLVYTRRTHNHGGRRIAGIDAGTIEILTRRDLAQIVICHTLKTFKMNYENMR